jgi:hypothetical protein
MTGRKPDQGIPAGTLVVVARGSREEQLGLTYTGCYGPGRWPFVRRWMGDRWTVRPAKARVLRVATDDDRVHFGLRPDALPIHPRPESPGAGERHKKE